MGEHAIGDLAEVLDNLGVFRSSPEDLVQLCSSGFRRVPIATGDDHYISLQAFAPQQVAFKHTHPDSEEWVVVLGGAGKAWFSDSPVPLVAGVVVGRGAAHPHGFTAGDEPLYLLSVQLPRPEEGATTWDEPGSTTDPIHCGTGGLCRRCPRCGGHSAPGPQGGFRCENCELNF
jgi:quercetin dioxygenase-like cupin family protein